MFDGIFSAFRALIGYARVAGTFIFDLFGGRIGGIFGRLLGLLGDVGVGILRVFNPIAEVVSAFFVGAYIGKFLNKFKSVQKTFQDFFY